MMSAKELVKAFYDSDIANDSNIVSEFFHKDCELHWSSSKGFITRHTLFVNPIENPDSEVVLARFCSIWEVKNNKLYRGYEISQLADENHEKAMSSYAERKI